MKKIILITVALLALAGLIFVVNDNSKSIQLLDTNLTKEEVKLFEKTLNGTQLINEFKLFEEGSWYGSGRTYKYKSLFSSKEITISSSYGEVIVDGQHYTLDPYEKIFDLNRQLEYNHGYPVQNDFIPERLYKFTYEEMFGTKDKEKYDFSYETWYVTGDVTVKALMEKLGFTYSDETKLVEDLYRELASNEFVLNKEIIFENIKLKLVGAYHGIKEYEGAAQSCYLVKIVN